MKKYMLVLLFSVALGAGAQTDKKYLAGAVPVENGYVEFKKSFDVPHKSKQEIFQSLKDYTQKELVEGPNRLNQARITEANAEEGILAASMEEFLYFKRTAMVSHGTRFFYQLIYKVGEGKFDVEMRRIHYIYDGSEGTSMNAQDIPAEKWITDDEALVKKGTKLSRISGKFRRFTIDRKDQIFRGAAKAAGVAMKTKVIEVEE